VRQLPRLAAALWSDLPRGLRRKPALAALFRDGNWMLRFWPLALAVPIAAATLGYRLGGFRSPTEQFVTSSVTVMALMLAVSTLGAAIGLWTALGFALGDLLRFRHTHDSALLYPDGLKHLTLVQVPLIISYTMLMLLLVTVPLLASTARASLTRQHGRSGLIQAAGIAFSSVIAAALAWCWARSAPMLIRPLWSFADTSGVVAAISPLERHGRVLVVVAAVGTAVRCLIEAVIPARAFPEPPLAIPTTPDAAPAKRHRYWSGVAVITRALLSTLLLSGLTSTWSDAIQLFAVILLASALRTVLLPAIPRYSDLVWRIPVPVRVLGCGLLGWWIGQKILAPAITSSSSNSMRPLLVAAMIGILATSPLLPARERTQM